MNFFRKNKWYISGFVVVLIIILLALLLPAFLFEFDYLETLGTQQLYVSIAAFSVIWITLLLTISQFSKSNAKPLIKVAFNKNGEQSFNLTYRDNKATTDLPPLWIINEGNAISQHFQIDIIIPESIINPEIIGKRLTYTTITRDNGNCIFSYTNDEDYTLFVHKPKQPQDMNLSIAIDNHKCMNLPKNNFKLKYYIYGDWAETQKGELTVKILKETGGTNAAGENWGYRGDGAV